MAKEKRVIHKLVPDEGVIEFESRLKQNILHLAKTMIVRVNLMVRLMDIVMLIWNFQVMADASRAFCSQLMLH